MASTGNLAVSYGTTPHGHLVGGVENYIGDLSFAEYWLRAHKAVLKLIDRDRVTGLEFSEYVASMNELSRDFEGQAAGGRGDAYNFAQTNPGNRGTGIISLLKLFSASGTEMLGPDATILDALGGDGTIARFIQSQNIQAPTIISADLSGFMVKACLDRNLPCIRQSADKSLLQDGALDGVLIAYGSHHLNSKSREYAAKEAFRTLKDGGRFVLHDFEVGSRTAQWFDQVVDKYSRTRHEFPHFTKDEMFRLLNDAGFKKEDISIFTMSDPFVLKGNSREDARKNALMHLYYMYDLVKITGSQNDILDQLESHAIRTFREIQIESSGSGYTATIPREALVAVGKRPDSNNSRLII